MQPNSRNLLVFGGGSGIGLAAAQIAAAEGAHVVVADINPAAAACAAAVDSSISFVQCDVTQPDSVENAVQQSLSEFGTLGRVLTTVGGAHLSNFDDLDQDVWDRELAFNLTSAYRIARAVLPQLRQHRGSGLVLTSSGQAIMQATDRAAYAAAKAGVISLTRSLAATVAVDGVRVNCIAPGPTDTPRFRAMNGGDAGVQEVRAAMPLGEIPTPHDCAHVALFLLSDAARAITGQTVHVNGGLLMP